MAVEVAQGTATIVPVDELVADQLYPGYRQAFASTPFIHEPILPFSKADEQHLWTADSIHFSQGLVPGSVALAEDCFTYGTQLAAENIGLPPGRGLRCRLGGTHIYMSPIDVSSPWLLQWRAGRFGRFLGYFLQNFREIWAAHQHELDVAHEYFRGLNPAELDDAALRAAIHDAYDYHRWAWTIHFEVMYPLIANYLGFYQLAAELGLDPAQISRYLAGEKTRFLETDEELWKLADRARDLGLAGTMQEGDLAGVRASVERQPSGAAWCGELDAFLEVYGWRIEENCVINLPPWIDDPAPALRAIRALLAQPRRHDFAAAQRAAIEERDRAIEEARSQIGHRADVERFDAALASCQAANFAWWNDHHNAFVDKRAAIPAHHLSKELGGRLTDSGELDSPEDVFFLFKQEVCDGLDDPSTWRRLKPLIPDRKAYYAEWKDKLPDLPQLVGTVPEAVADPILIEVFGLSRHYLDTLRHAGEPTSELRGLAASHGVVEGTARVITGTAGLPELQPGEILVCQGTDPEWTPVFGYIKACVCDAGGSLTHAAIISREYGIPCVVGTGLATANIRTGDRVRVDGTSGVVTVYR